MEQRPRRPVGQLMAQHGLEQPAAMALPLAVGPGGHGPEHRHAVLEHAVIARDQVAHRRTAPRPRGPSPRLRRRGWRRSPRLVQPIASPAARGPHRGLRESAGGRRWRGGPEGTSSLSTISGSEPTVTQPRRPASGRWPDPARTSMMIAGRFNASVGSRHRSARRVAARRVAARQVVVEIALAAEGGPPVLPHFEEIWLRPQATGLPEHPPEVGRDVRHGAEPSRPDVADRGA